MEAQRCVKLTGTNEPCGLTITHLPEGPKRPPVDTATPLGRCGTLFLRSPALAGPAQWETRAAVCRVFSCPPPRSTLPRRGRRSLKDGAGPFARPAVKIVWDDSGFARCASYVGQAMAACPSKRRRGAETETPGNQFPGGHRGRVTPVPIPNTVVKPATADGTACVGVWESRSLPGLISEGTAPGRSGRH